MEEDAVFEQSIYTCANGWGAVLMEPNLIWDKVCPWFEKISAKTVMKACLDWVS